MSSRRPTLAEQRYPGTPEFQQVAQRAKVGAIELLTDAVWAGYDALRTEVLDQIPELVRGDEGERSITQLLAPRISRALSGYEPFYCLHAVKEMETRKPAPAQAPEYDIAFVLRVNERICWPLEAKLLSTDQTIAPYINDIKHEFLTCRYAPFSSGGAMIGYLISGDADCFFDNVASALQVELLPRNPATARPHRISIHHRQVPAGKRYPPLFTCHHLIMQLEPAP